MYRKQSLYNNLVVTCCGSRVTLWSPEGVRQSVFDMDNPAVPGLEYAKYMLLALTFIPAPGSVVAIGLGGGTIPMALSELLQKCLIHVVEIDSEVLSIANNFFGFKEAPLMRVFIEDGYIFIKNSTDLYDIALVDAYKGGSQPKALSSKLFFHNLAKTLRPEGLCVINLVTTDSESLNNTISNMKTVFKNTWYIQCKTSRNVVYFASNYDYDKLILVANIRKIQELLSLGYLEILQHTKKLQGDNGWGAVTRFLKRLFLDGILF